MRLKLASHLMTKQKVFRFKPYSFIFILVLLSLVLAACAGGQAPAASKARSRAVINAGDIVPAEQIRVAEYLRYYEQHFPEPEEGVLGLDLRLGNEQMPRQGGLVWLQMGMQAKSAEEDIVAPLNLALVIDRSGSMDTADKMPYLKQSLRIFLESLNPDDIVSIVTYSTHAELLLPAQPVGDGRWIQRTIDRIVPLGNTNLYAGMMLGLQEVDKHFDVRRNNRVILLTDGIANRGVTDPDQIAADALAYTERNIYLSTIGLGLDFNDELLSRLAYEGQGGYSFVDSAEEMDRIFREHVAGLKQRVASEVSLTIIPEPGVQLVGLTGLQGTPPAEGVNIPLPPIGTGESGVLLAQLKVDPTRQDSPSGERSLVKVQLRYFDEFAQHPVTAEQVVNVKPVTDMPDYDPTWDLEILRNITIQQTAEGMIEIDRLFQARQYETAWRLAAALEERVAEVARLTEDEQMQDDVALMQRYQQTLAEAVRQTEGRAPRRTDDQPEPETERPYRGRPEGTPTPTPSVPVIEIR